MCKDCRIYCECDCCLGNVPLFLCINCLSLQDDLQDEKLKNGD